jgi:PIN domain nuclease of toxin-antitoxin system
VRLLLDTNIALWIATQRRAIPAATRRLIDEANAVLVSAASVWEIGIKVALGKLDLDMDELIHDFTASGFQRLGVTWEHGRAVRDLPDLHRDPFGRLLVAQAMIEPLHLVTSDRLLARYSDLVIVV